ncbi:ABC transporter substrate-binding protein [Paenibacillus hemerocallicola]|nr:extracellular solute-binding protein [Paenibacillus hemerocallicola]
MSGKAKRKRYLNSGLTTVLAFAALLSACQEGGNSGKSESSSVKPEELPPANLTIFSTSGWSQEAFDDRFGNLLRKKFPQHTITYQSGKNYDDLILTGSKVDIVWESIAAYSNARPYNIQYDMTELIERHQVDLSRIDLTFIDAMKTMGDGKINGLPVLNNTLGLYYNKDLFDQFGVPYPKDHMTWDEVLELNKRLTIANNGTTYVGLAFLLEHFLRLNSFSLPYVETGTLRASFDKNDRWNILFDTLTRATSVPLYRDTITSSKKIPDTVSFFKDRNSAMLVGLVNSHLTQDVSGLNWDIVSFPTFKEAPNVGPQASPTIFGIAATSDHKDQSMELIKYLISDEFQISVSRSGALPVVNSPEVVSAFGKETAFTDKNLKAAFSSKLAPISAKTIYDGEVWKVVNKNTMPLVTGTTDLNTMLRSTEEEANAIIQSMKIK